MEYQIEFDMKKEKESPLLKRLKEKQAPKKKKVKKVKHTNKKKTLDGPFKRLKELAEEEFSSNFYMLVNPDGNWEIYKEKYGKEGSKTKLVDSGKIW